MHHGAYQLETHVVPGILPLGLAGCDEAGRKQRPHSLTEIAIELSIQERDLSLFKTLLNVGQNVFKLFDDFWTLEMSWNYFLKDVHQTVEIWWHCQPLPKQVCDVPCSAARGHVILN
jgi:hypothetical protein